MATRWWLAKRACALAMLVLLVYAPVASAVEPIHVGSVTRYVSFDESTPTCIGANPAAGCVVRLPGAHVYGSVYVSSDPVPDTDWNILALAASVDGEAAGRDLGGGNVSATLSPPTPPFPGPGPCGTTCLLPWLSDYAIEVVLWLTAMAEYGEGTACEQAPTACRTVDGLRDDLDNGCTLTCVEPRPRGSAMAVDILP